MERGDELAQQSDLDRAILAAYDAPPGSLERSRLFYRAVMLCLGSDPRLDALIHEAAEPILFATPVAADEPPANLDRLLDDMAMQRRRRQNDEANQRRFPLPQYWK